MKIILMLLIFSISILSAKDMYAVGERDILLKGNGEQCNITYNTSHDTIIQTNCLSLTNSKKVKILCTKKKRICKTEKEVIDYAYALNTNNQNTTKYGRKEKSYITDKGTKFYFSVNSHGEILKSKSYTIYLGKSCDVVSPEFGKGSWKETNRGFSINFENNNRNIIFENNQKPTIECLDELPMGYNYANSDTNQFCKDTISSSKLSSINPYKLKGYCVKGIFYIKQNLSKNKVFAYPMYYDRWTNVQTMNRAVEIEVTENFSTLYLAEGNKIYGVFQIIDTDKEMLTSGETVPVNKLKTLRDIKFY